MEQVNLRALANRNTALESHRGGTGEIRYVAVDILDRSGRAASSVREGGALTVRATYDASVPVHAPVFQIAIVDVDTGMTGAAAAAMIATLRHRGPDDTGIWSGGAAALGAARLSVIDVAGGHQPIAVDSGRIVVVQNGEIYNYVELRRDLERRGRSFATASDTEVIAALYAEHGEAAFERMRRMFAMAIWDAARQRRWPA